jgi:hypothetical protein
MVIDGKLRWCCDVYVESPKSWQGHLKGNSRNGTLQTKGQCVKSLVSMECLRKGKEASELQES